MRSLELTKTDQIITYLNSLAVGVTAQVCSDALSGNKIDLEASRPAHALLRYLPVEKRLRNSLFQGRYFESILASLDASYHILDRNSTQKLFKTLENILMAFYNFKVNMQGNPFEMLGEIHKATEKMSKSTTGTPESPGSLNSSVNSNLIEMSTRKTSENLSDDEEKLEAEIVDPKYYEAAVMFHTVPDLQNVCDRVLVLFDQVEAGGLHLLNVFIDNEIVMDFKLLQCFVINAFVWGSTPIGEYFDGKEHQDYGDCVSQAFVHSRIT